MSWIPPGGVGSVIGVDKIAEHQHEYHSNGRPCEMFKGMVCPLQWVTIINIALTTNPDQRAALRALSALLKERGVVALYGLRQNIVDVVLGAALGVK